jgi:hypothetical protein
MTMPRSQLAPIAMLALMTTACRTDIGVGKSDDISSDQALAYERDQAGGFLPPIIEDHPGRGRAVQPDRMVTVDLAFHDAGGRPAGSGRIRFIHSSRDTTFSSAGFTFGYVSPVLLGAMAGMREGGRRSVRLTDSFCADPSPSYHPKSCSAFGAIRETPKNGPDGSIDYPRGAALQVSISILRVCRPTIVRIDYPDLMGGGPGRKLREVSCR